jgi:phage terminase small subunit
MARGRRPIPDAIKRLKGSRIRRGQLLRDAASGNSSVAEPIAGEIPAPAFLTARREREIFHEASQLLRWTAQRPDYNMLARWASYLGMWLDVKTELAGRVTYRSKSKHGALERKSPRFLVLLDIEKALQSLEDRLGLNPQARQYLGRRFAAAAFAEGEEISPIGFLNRQPN